VTHSAGHPTRRSDAAARLLLGDEPREAAGHLEGALLDAYPGDEGVEELLGALERALIRLRLAPR
jgi:hypothetical protein